eukprot:Filipodium_phascolosomae@DN1774_c0_g1_i2.p1
MIQTDVRNNSAWNHRYHVLTHITNPITDEVRSKEVDYCIICLLKVPTNEAAWNYVKGFFSIGPPSGSKVPFYEAPEGLLTFCRNCVSSIKYVDDDASQTTDEDASDERQPSQKMVNPRFAVEFLARFYQSIFMHRCRNRLGEYKSEEEAPNTTKTSKERIEENYLHMMKQEKLAVLEVTSTEPKRVEAVDYFCEPYSAVKGNVETVNDKVLLEAFEQCYRCNSFLANVCDQVRNQYFTWVSDQLTKELQILIT